MVKEDENGGNHHNHLDKRRRNTNLPPVANGLEYPGLISLRAESPARSQTGRHLVLQLAATMGRHLTTGGVKTASFKKTLATKIKTWLANYHAARANSLTMPRISGSVYQLYLRTRCS